MHISNTKTYNLISSLAAGQNQPSASVHKSSTSFVTIKEGDSPDAALLKHQDSQSATSYQYVRRSGGSSRVEGIQSQGRIDTPTGHSSGSYRYSTKNTYTSSTQTGGEGKQYVQQTRQSRILCFSYYILNILD